MFPQFFGPTDEPLYGVYHMPEPGGGSGGGSGARSATGVVLCQPVLHEGVDARRAVRALAERLARAGHHVLRFDYRGSGDSAGDGETCDVGQWRADVGTAIDELKASRGLEAVGLVGIRYGATLAAEVAAERDDVPFLVLWEPIVQGAPYVEGLRRRHAAWIAYETEQRPEARHLITDTELLGLPFAPELARGMAAADLRELASRPAPRVLVVDEGLPASEVGLGDMGGRLGALGVAVERQRLDGGRVWHRDIDGEWAPVPQQVVSAIVDWVGGAGS